MTSFGFIHVNEWVNHSIHDLVLDRVMGQTKFNDLFNIITHDIDLSHKGSWFKINLLLF